MKMAIVGAGSIGKLRHDRTMTPVEPNKFQIVRQNRDTLYSSVVLDLESKATITLPPTNRYYMSLHAIDEDQYTIGVFYPHNKKETEVSLSYEESDKKIQIKRKGIVGKDKNIVSNTRYVIVLFRTFIDPTNETDITRANSLQDAISVKQKKIGKLDVPNWDIALLQKVEASIAGMLPYVDSRMPTLGYEADLEATHHLIGSATIWGGLPRKASTYLTFFPPSDDSSLVFKIPLKDVPIMQGGFWSITVYNATGYFEYNEHNSYSLNSVTSKPEDDGSYEIYFSNSKKDEMKNWIWIYPGWNYLVRLYKPTEAIIKHTWTFQAMAIVE